MERRIILRGGLLGALGGLLAFVFARIFAEPIIQRAIEYEEGRDEAQHKLEEAAGGHSHGDGAELFTRAVQSNFGIAVGIIAFGFAMGLLFAVLYTVLYGRCSSLNPTNLTLVLAGAMFFVLYLVPFLKYPANPPAVGHEDTIRAINDAGLDHYIAKPWTPEDLRATVVEQLTDFVIDQGLDLLDHLDVLDAPRLLEAYSRGTRPD